MKKVNLVTATFLLVSALPAWATIVLQVVEDRHRFDETQYRSAMSGIIMVPGYVPSGLRSPKVARSVQRAGTWSDGGNGCCAVDVPGIVAMEAVWMSKDRPSLARANAVRARSFADR